MSDAPAPDDRNAHGPIWPLVALFLSIFWTLVGVWMWPHWQAIRQTVAGILPAIT